MLVTTPQTDFEPIHSMLMNNSLSSKAIIGAVELHIFDRLDGRALTAAALAEEGGWVTTRLEPLLDILVAADLLTRNNGEYTNTPVASEFLVTTAPLYQGDCMALTMRFASSVENAIAELVAGGEVDRTEADNGWALEKVMEGTAQDACGVALPRVVQLVAGLPGFHDFRTMADVGGNHGHYTMGVLEQNPDMQGTIFDLPHVAEQSRLRCERFGFGDRIATQGLDFRKQALPAGQFDLILMSHILYGFKGDLGSTLGKIADGLKPGGWFVSHHFSRHQTNGGEMAKASLELITRLAGYPSHFIEQEELSEHLASAGFTDVRFEPVSSKGLGLMTAARKPA